ncbi:MAG: prephenate dehydratase [Solirubrobacteraceae bacterium]|jgi:prephenate dehydratase
MRIGYLGPEGTFSHQALLNSRPPHDAQAVALATLYDTVVAVQDGSVDVSLVPIENALEGSVDVTLDTLAADADDVTIIGETVQRIRNCLIVGGPVVLEDIEAIYSHPQPSGQCARFLRTRVPGARIVAASSTAEAVRTVAGAPGQPHAALGNRLAAELYGAEVLLEDVDDIDGNVTRFVWLARSERATELRRLVERGETTKTSIVFWGGGDEAAGWLVSCLSELSQRDISLTRVESRPRRIGLGNYMFFADLAGSMAEPRLHDAIEGLHRHCEDVRVLGSYRVS